MLQISLKPSIHPCAVCVDTEAVDVKFTEVAPFAGSLCWKCIQKMYKARVNGKEKDAPS